MKHTSPQILAPAGDRDSFLAALAAGADAVYVGLKHFSARMQAANFSMADLSRLTEMASKRGTAVYVAFNTLLKPGELYKAGRLIDRLQRGPKPSGIICQDLAVLDLARQAGYEGELHLSTLANVSHPAGLAAARQAGADRVVLPRELSIDEIKACAAACPQGLSLEVFVHGALCYGVSGRCWWSSQMGGKSGLRGRCVQPCRRQYTLVGKSGSRGGYFSCDDLGLDVLVKTLKEIPEISAWKIEGRKKGPHYVYYTTTAYAMLKERDDAEAKKTAMSLLEQALGRPTSHYAFLPQRPQVPITPGRRPGSGLFVGVTQGGKGGFSVSPILPLLPGDLLRIGFQDEPWHQMVKVRKGVPKRGRLDVRSLPPRRKGDKSPKGPSIPSPRAKTPVFLIDRRESELVRILRDMNEELAAIPEPAAQKSILKVKTPRPAPRPRAVETVDVVRGRPGSARWIDAGRMKDLPPRINAESWWWLPPVIWPIAESKWRQAVAELLGRGARRFMLGQPWQIALFPDDVDDATLWAGPFCNVANGLACEQLAEMGFSGAVASPELTREDALALPEQSPIPLGFVIQGAWPFCISRTKSHEVKLGAPFVSPKNEAGYVRKVGDDFWIMPNWELDLREAAPELEKAGYALFIRLVDRLPKGVQGRGRPSTFNWDLQLV
jgi:putative protease